MAGEVRTNWMLDVCDFLKYFLASADRDCQLKDHNGMSLCAE